VRAGAYFIEAKDTNSGTIKIKRGDAAVFATGQTSFSRNLPAVNTVQRTHPDTWIEFSSGSGIVTAEYDKDCGDIYVYGATVAIADAAVALKS